MKRHQTPEEVKKEILTVFPKETGKLFYELLTSVTHLHLNWINYRSLFGTSPPKKLNLEQDIRLIKAALLYADSVKLYSHASSMTMALLKLSEFSPEKQLSFWESVIPYVTSRSNSKEILRHIKRFKKIQKNPHPSSSDLQFLRATRELNAKQWKHFANQALEIANNAGIDSIKRALNTGLLQVHTFKDLANDKSIIEFAIDCIAGAYKKKLSEKRSPQIEEHEDSMIWEFVEELATAIIDGHTHPLFDAGTSNLIRLIISVNLIKVSDVKKNRAKQSGLAGQLLIQLPVFDKATMDEILDIRSDLQKHLIRFRSALIQFSESIESAQWDKDFPLEVENVINRDVRPSILEIEEEIKANSFLSSLIPKFVEEPLILPSGTALAIILSRFKSLPEMIIEGMGISAMAAAVVYDAFKDWRERRRKIQKNNLYFYYLAERKLKS